MSPHPVRTLVGGKHRDHLQGLGSHGEKLQVARRGGEQRPGDNPSASRGPSRVPPLSLPARAPPRALVPHPTLSRSAQGLPSSPHPASCTVTAPNTASPLGLEGQEQGDRGRLERSPSLRAVGSGLEWELESVEGAQGREVSERPGTRPGTEEGAPSRHRRAARALCVLAQQDPWAARYVTIPAISCPINEKGADINTRSA